MAFVLGEHPRGGLFRIAREIGKSIEEVERLSNREIEEWFALFSLEDERSELRAKAGK